MPQIEEAPQIDFSGNMWLRAFCVVSLACCFGYAKPSHAQGTTNVPTLAKIWPTNNNVGISGYCHVLLFYGLGTTDLPGVPSGEAALRALTDEQAAIQTFGKTPFVRTRNGLRYFISRDPVFNTEVGETHRDQCLATFAALDLKLDTPIHLKGYSYSISNLLSESIANFAFDQHEPAWTALAYTKYLPPKKEWANRFGERTTFSQLARHLLNLDLKSQSCAGTHIFNALAKIHKADRRYSILDSKTQKELDSFMTTMLRGVVQRQQKDGSWNNQWYAPGPDLGAGAKPTVESKILVTGHLLEVLNSLDSERRPLDVVYLRAAECLRQSLNSPEIHNDGYGHLICPFTHAARTAREILSPTQTNRLSLADTFHHTE